MKFKRGDRVVIVNDGRCRPEFWNRVGTIVGTGLHDAPWVLLDSRDEEHRSGSEDGSWEFHPEAVWPLPPTTFPEIDHYLEEGSDASA